MQKWEYCVLEGLYYKSIYTPLACKYPKLLRLGNKGLELVTDFKNRAKGVNEIDAVAETIAQLGDEGWELTCALGDASLWFKRPKA